MAPAHPFGGYQTTIENALFGVLAAAQSIFPAPPDTIAKNRIHIPAHFLPTVAVPVNPNMGTPRRTPARISKTKHSQVKPRGSYNHADSALNRTNRKKVMLKLSLNKNKSLPSAVNTDAGKGDEEDTERCGKILPATFRSIPFPDLESEDIAESEAEIEILDSPLKYNKHVALEAEADVQIDSGTATPCERPIPAPKPIRHTIVPVDRHAHLREEATSLRAQITEFTSLGFCALIKNPFPSQEDLTFRPTIPGESSQSAEERHHLITQNYRLRVNLQGVKQLHKEITRGEFGVIQGEWFVFTSGPYEYDCRYQPISPAHETEEMEQEEEMPRKIKLKMRVGRVREEDDEFTL